MIYCSFLTVTLTVFSAVRRDWWDYYVDICYKTVLYNVYLLYVFLTISWYLVYSYNVYTFKITERNVQIKTWINTSWFCMYNIKKIICRTLTIHVNCIHVAYANLGIFLTQYDIYQCKIYLIYLLTVYTVNILVPWRGSSPNFAPNIALIAKCYRYRFWSLYFVNKVHS